MAAQGLALRDWNFYGMRPPVIHLGSRHRRQPRRPNQGHVEGTKVSLESQGKGVHVREFDFLREVPDICELRAEADRIIAERASSAGVPPAVRGRGWGRPRDWFSRLTTL